MQWMFQRFETYVQSLGLLGARVKKEANAVVRAGQFEMGAANIVLLMRLCGKATNNVVMQS
jgi:hypothetical protein